MSATCTGSSRLSVVRSIRMRKLVKTRRRGKSVKVQKWVTQTKEFRQTGVLRPVWDHCESKIALKLPVKHFNGKQVKFTHSAAGNASLLPVSATGAIKLPKVKAKKRPKKK